MGSTNVLLPPADFRVTVLIVLMEPATQQVHAQMVDQPTFALFDVKEKLITGLID